MRDFFCSFAGLFITHQLNSIFRVETNIILPFAKGHFSFSNRSSDIFYRL